MARIRTIKPEFTQSETIGRLSRDARLLFIQIWTIVDDSGRARASSRGLASSLYPFDELSTGLVDVWLDELVGENLIQLYVVEGSTYLEVKNWLKHQKIDRPSPSKLPAFVEGSSKPRRGLAAGPSTLDRGPGTVDRGPGTVEGDASAKPREGSAKPRTQPRATRWPADAVVPDEWITAGVAARVAAGMPAANLKAEAVKFANYWSSKSGAAATKLDWKKTWINWTITSRSDTRGKQGHSEHAFGVFGQLADDLRAAEEVQGGDGATIIEVSTTE